MATPTYGFGMPSMTNPLYTAGGGGFNELTGMPSALTGAAPNPYAQLSQFGFQQAPNNQLFLPWSAWQQQIAAPGVDQTSGGPTPTVAGYNLPYMDYSQETPQQQTKQFTDPTQAFNWYSQNFATGAPGGLGGTPGGAGNFQLPMIQDTLANTNNPSYFGYQGVGTPTTLGGQQGFLLDPTKLGAYEKPEDTSNWVDFRNGPMPVALAALGGLAFSGAGAADAGAGAGAGADATGAATTGADAGAGTAATGAASAPAGAGIGDIFGGSVDPAAFNPATDLGAVSTGAPALNPITGGAASSGAGSILGKLGNALTGGGSGSGGLLGNIGGAVGNMAPGLLALNYAKQNQPIDTSQLQSVFNQAGANAPLFTQAAIAPAQQAQAQGYGDILQSQGLRGIRGSSFGDTDISNFLNSTNRQIGNIGANAAEQVLGLQGALGGNIAQLNAQSQLLRNNLYGRAFDLLGRGLGSSAPGGGTVGGNLGSGIGSLLGMIGSGIGDLFS